MTQIPGRKKLLIISHDKIGSKMAGPGIRYHFMAEYLSSDFDVCVGFFEPTNLPDSKFKKSYTVRSIDAFEFENDFKDFDYIIALWLSDSMMNYCNINNMVVIFDIYAPVPVENLASQLFSSRKNTADKDRDYRSSLVMYQKFLENGDLFLYSNYRQRDFWMGYIFGALQIFPSLYNDRPMYDRFIEAPMGIDDKVKPRHTKDVLRGTVGTITKKDIVILWTGGIWDWFDGVTPIDAMSIIEKSGRKDIKLVFLGTQHPNESIPEMAEVSHARKAASDSGLLDKSVFFLDGWVSYEDRVNYLLEADLAIYCHKPSIETEFSHRTRVLDHFFASLPTIGTKGDYLGDIIEENNMGIMVNPQNSQELADAILRASSPEMLKTFKKSVQKHRKEFGWSTTLNPLRNYLLSNPTKIERLPNVNAPLSKKVFEKLKKKIPRPVKVLVKRILSLPTRLIR